MDTSQRRGAWKSKLNPFEKEIFKLWSQEYSLRQIVEYLQEKHDIKISPQGLHNFIKVRQKKANPHNIPVYMQPQINASHSPSVANNDEAESAKQNETEDDWSKLSTAERARKMLKQIEEERKGEVTYHN